MGLIWHARVALVASAQFAATPALAEPVDACISAFESAQVERDQGRLTRSRELLLRCSREPCPTVIRQDCREWLFELEPRVPTAVLRARLGDGTDLSDVRVFVDGELLVSKLDGRPVRLDPGERLLRWEHAGFAPVETRIIVREGEKNRFVSAVFSAREGESEAEPTSSGHGPTEADREPHESTDVPVGVWAAGGVGVVGLGTFTVLGLSVQSRESDFESTCAPNCTPSRVQALERDALIANVALGVGLAGFAIATWILLSSDPKPSQPGVALEVGVQPGAPGAYVAGRF